MTLWPVLIASVVGSPHCAAMCGLIAAGAGRGTGPQTLYHLGRLTGYVALGAVAGALGQGLNHAGLLVGVASAATQLAGVLLVAAGLTGILASLGVRLGGAAAVHRWAVALAARLGHIPPRRRAWSLGMITAVLPCGWLLAFVATAGGAGTPALGAITMGVFWVGTVPLLAAAGGLVRKASGPLRRRLPLMSATALIVLGVLTVVRPISHSPNPVSPGHGHLGR